MHAAVVSSHFPPEWTTGVAAPPRMKLLHWGTGGPFARALTAARFRCREALTRFGGQSDLDFSIGVFQNEKAPREGGRRRRHMGTRRRVEEVSTEKSPWISDPGARWCVYDLTAAITPDGSVRNASRTRSCSRSCRSCRSFCRS
jgi:hypothetical protein